MCDLFAGVKAQRIAPVGRSPGVGMTGRRRVAGVPAPYAGRAVANAGGRSTQQAPVKRAANLVRASMFKSSNIWFLSSMLVSLGVLIPIVTVFFSFFETTSNYYEILKNTFLVEYIFNSFVLLVSVLVQKNNTNSVWILFHL